MQRTFVSGGDRLTPRHDEERTTRIKELIEHLPPEYGSVLEQCLVNGLTFKEAGERLGLSADVVRQRYQGVREILQKKKGDGQR